jgi:hypothetical protein
MYTPPYNIQNATPIINIDNNSTEFIPMSTQPINYSRQPIPNSKLTINDVLHYNYLNGIKHIPYDTNYWLYFMEYFKKSRLNNLPRKISCNTDLCVKKRIVKSIFGLPQLLLLFTIYDWVFIAFVVGMTVLLVNFDCYYEPDIGLLLTLILFPLTYAIGNSFTKQTDLLSIIATIRTSTIGLSIALQQINQSNNDDQLKHKLICKILQHIKLHHDDCKEYAKSKNETKRIYFLQRIYSRIVHISWMIKFILTGQEDYMHGRVDGYFNSILDSFERFRCDIDYQTSTTIEYFLTMVTFTNILFLIPWFSKIVITSHNISIMGYFFTASVTATILGFLRIQQRLSNPIGNDWDDINFDEILAFNLLYESFRFIDKDGNINRHNIKLFMGRDDYNVKDIFT